MTEHLTEQQIALYRTGAADSDGRQKTAAHLAVCQSCVAQVLNLEHSAVAFNALTQAFLPSPNEEPFHLSTAELQSYVAGSSAKADQIICESHIEICEQCEIELRRLSSDHRSERTPKVASPWSSWGYLTPARLAAAVALIGLLTVVALVWWQRTSRPTPPESVKNGTQPSPAPDQHLVAEASPQPGNESVASNPAIVATLKDSGREIRLDQEGKLSGLEDFSESWQEMIKTTLAGKALEKPKVLEGLSAPPIKLAGETDPQTFQIIGPAGKVISERRPTLNWQPLSGATSYVVSIFDDNFDRVTSSPPLSKTTWTVDEPLRWGRSYSWEVAATTDGKEIIAPIAPEPRAQIKLLEADKVTALSKLKQKKPASHLALGLLYARVGLVSEAEAEFRKLVKENPDSAVAKRLLRAVQSWH
jgi:hypothetical protein